MKYELNGTEITFFLKGELNSTNAEAIHGEILDALGKSKATRIVINLREMTYVSSAGLRIFLSLKKRYNDLLLDETPLEVYDILEMTGFSKMMEVKRKLAEVDVTGKKVIGEGRTGIVYRIDKDTIVKVYKRKVDISEIEKEMELSRESFVLGIPTAITFDIVKVGDKLASRFEMLDCETLSEVIRRDPAHLNSYIDLYSDLLKTIHTTTSFTLSLPKKKEKWRGYIENCRELIDKPHGDKLLAMFEAIPDVDTFLHGDCHIKNIMCDGKNVFLIDMGSLSTGYPIFDLGALYRTYFGFDFSEPGNTESFLELSRSLCDRIYFGLLDRYFAGRADKAVQDKIALAGTAYLLSWAYRYEGKDSPRCLDAAKRLPDLIDRVDDLLLPI